MHCSVKCCHKSVVSIIMLGRSGQSSAAQLKCRHKILCNREKWATVHIVCGCSAYQLRYSTLHSAQRTVTPCSLTVAQWHRHSYRVVKLCSKVSHSCIEPSVPSVEVTQTRLPHPNGSVSGMIMKPRPKLSSLSAVSSFVNHLKDLNQQMC